MSCSLSNYDSWGCKREVGEGVVEEVDFSSLKSPVSVLVEGNQKLSRHGVMASRSLNVLDSSGSIAVMVLNVSNAPVELHRHRVVGSVSPLVDTVASISILEGHTSMGGPDPDVDSPSSSSPVESCVDGEELVKGSLAAFYPENRPKLVDFSPKYLDWHLPRGMKREVPVHGGDSGDVGVGSIGIWTLIFYHLRMMILFLNFP